MERYISLGFILSIIVDNKLSDYAIVLLYDNHILIKKSYLNFDYILINRESANVFNKLFRE